MACRQYFFRYTGSDRPKEFTKKFTSTKFYIVPVGRRSSIGIAIPGQPSQQKEALLGVKNKRFSLLSQLKFYSFSTKNRDNRKTFFLTAQKLFYRVFMMHSSGNNSN